jgi:formate dehydrogenase subunit gamma
MTSRSELTRFDTVERAVHWANATLFIVLLFTGLALRGFPGTQWVGRRLLVKDIHVWSGVLLPIPILFGLFAGRLGSELRRDLRRIGRWTVDDQRWWRRRSRASVSLGKFNPGQKLNAAFVGASLIVMPATGWMLRFPGPFSNTLRRGATVTHRWFAFALLVTIIGHILYALADSEAMRAMLRGRVSEEWARAEHPRWHAEMTPTTRSDEVATPR